MGVYIKDLKKPEDCDVCSIRLVFITCGCDRDHCMFQDVPEPHGRLIDAYEFLERAIGTKCFRGDYVLMLEELVGESTTIIPASEEGET